MARDFHYGNKKSPKTTFKRRKQQPDWQTARIPHNASERRKEDALKHAVTHGDLEALQDYDEAEF